jgi:CHASE2 domain-containing sensor protein
MLRRLLTALLAIESISALGGGVYGISGAPQIPREWLQGSPFVDYTIPSWILILFVGGSAAFASIAGFRAAAHFLSSARLAAIVLIVWIGVQVAMIGYVSPLQPIMATFGVVVLGLAHLIAMQSRARPNTEGDV